MFRTRKKRYLKVVLCLGILLTITSSYAMWDRLSDTATATIKLETQTQSSTAQEIKMPVKSAGKGKTAEPINEPTHETKEKKMETESTGQDSNQTQSPTDSTVE